MPKQACPGTVRRGLVGPRRFYSGFFLTLLLILVALRSLAALLALLALAILASRHRRIRHTARKANGK